MQWLQRLEELARQQARGLEQLGSHEDDPRRVEAAIPPERAALEESQALAGQLRHRLESVNELQNDLLQQVRLNCQGFDYTESMYKKQQALQETVLYRLKQEENRRENLMQEERQLRSLAEMYSGSEYFTADPHLGDRLRAWQTRFSYLRSGTRFIQEAAQRQGTDTEAYYRLYSYWAISVICQTAEREKLIRMLEEERPRLEPPGAGPGPGGSPQLAGWPPGSAL